MSHYQNDQRVQFCYNGYDVLGLHIIFHLFVYVHFLVLICVYVVFNRVHIPVISVYFLVFNLCLFFVFMFLFFTLGLFYF